MTTWSKDVFISYAKRDRETANRLREILREQFGDAVWMRDFDLDSGDLVYNVLSEAVSEARWLIILLSAKSVKSQWLQYEANYATIRALQDDENFRIILIRLEECEYPKHLEIAFSKLYTVDLTLKNDPLDAFIDVADYLEKAENLPSEKLVYEGRGADTDRISLIARRNKIIFIIGWRGIGKTVFVANSIKPLFKKRPLVVNLTIGHFHDLLARQIIQQARLTLQPRNHGRLSDLEFLNLAIDALKVHAGRFFLLLDNAQNGLDNSNRLLPYLSDFLTAFQSANLDTHVLLATTRSPDYPEEISKTTEVYRLGVIADEYIEDIICQWLESCDKLNQIMGTQEMKQLVRVVGGHPLAAKRMSSYLRFKSADQLLTAVRRERFQLGFAEYVLRATQSDLSELHRLILQILAMIREPITQTDMMQVTVLSNKYSLDLIHQARWELSDWFLIEQTGELMFLHGFLLTYFGNQLRKEENLQKDIASEFGLYAHKKTLELDKYLDENFVSLDEQAKIDLSNEVFRYAVAADRLLRIVGLDELADGLPIRTKGVLRGLVYYFYQDVGDYRKALEYTEKWLDVNPDDPDIKLYRIRCYRKLGGTKENLDKARELIAEMEKEVSSLQFAIRLLRERALIAQQEGDTELAKSYFRQAIKMDSRVKPYSEIYAGLARIRIKEADNLPEFTLEKQEIADESVELLEVAKLEPDNFYRFHLDAYVEALIQAGEDDKAYPLLTEALEYRPEDEKLNFRMAEVLRKRKAFDEAIQYAEVAQKQGYAPSILTHANIFFDKAVQLNEQGKRQKSLELLQKATKKISIYKQQYGNKVSEYNMEVADTIQCKIHRMRSELDEALSLIYVYRNSNDPYTVYEHALLYVLRSDRSSTQQKYADALSDIRDAIDRIRAYRYKLPVQLEELLALALDKQSNLERIFSI